MRFTTLLSLLFCLGTGFLSPQDDAAELPLEERIPKDLSNRREVRDLQLRLTLLRRNSKLFGERHPQTASIKEQILKLEEELLRLIQRIENEPAPKREALSGGSTTQSQQNSAGSIPAKPTRELKKALGLKERPAWVQPNAPALRSNSAFQWRPLPPSGFRDAWVKLGAFPMRDYLWGLEQFENSSGSAWVTWQENSPTQTRERQWTSNQIVVDAVLDTEFSKTGRVYFVAHSRDQPKRLELSSFLANVDPPFELKSAPKLIASFESNRERSAHLIVGPTGTVFFCGETQSDLDKQNNASVRRIGNQVLWFSVEASFPFDDYVTNARSESSSAQHQVGNGFEFEPFLLAYDDTRKTLWRWTAHDEQCQLEPVVSLNNHPNPIRWEAPEMRTWKHLLIDSTGDRRDEFPRIVIASDAPAKVFKLERSQEKTEVRDLASTSRAIKRLAMSADGRLLSQDDYGQGYRLMPWNESYAAELPTKLSKLRLFSDLQSGQMQSGFIPYSVKDEMFSSSKQNSNGYRIDRWIGVPSGRVEFNASEEGIYTEGTMFVQNLRQPSAKFPKGRLIETRLMIYQAREWYPFVYEWDDDNTDARLVESEGDSRVMSRDQCFACHQQPNNQFILGFKPSTLAEYHRYKEGEASLQYRTLVHLEILR